MNQIMFAVPIGVINPKPVEKPKKKKKRLHPTRTVILLFQNRARKHLCLGYDMRTHMHVSQRPVTVTQVIHISYRIILNIYNMYK